MKGLIIIMILGMAIAVVTAGCKKRYIPRVTEEIIDPGVPVYEETIVE